MTVKLVKNVTSTTQDLDGGRVLGPGEFAEAEVSAKDGPVAKAAIDEGRLRVATQPKPPPEPAASPARSSDSPKGDR